MKKTFVTILTAIILATSIIIPVSATMKSKSVFVTTPAQHTISYSNATKATRSAPSLKRYNGVYVGVIVPSYATLPSTKELTKTAKIMIHNMEYSK